MRAAASRPWPGSSLVPALVAAGYQVVTFDNRGVAPSSSPPAPYTMDEMVDDTARAARPPRAGRGPHRRALHGRMDGRDDWPSGIPDRVRSAVFMGSCNVGDLVGEGHHHRRARPGPARLRRCPRWFYATETLRYLPNHDIQDDDVVDLWLSIIGDLEPWPNPGRLGQYEAALAWSLDVERTARWPELSRAVPGARLRARRRLPSGPGPRGGSRIPGARFEVIAGASHLGVFTHGADVSALLVDFFSQL